jgi:hypothetical protein
VRQFAPIAGMAQYTAGGHGFDAADDLVLIGPQETVRLDRDSQRLEPFGGAVAADFGAVFHDLHGNLYLHAGTALFTLRGTAGTWTPVELPTAPPLAYVLRDVGVDRSGTISARFEYTGSNPGESGIAVCRRGLAAPSWTQVFQVAKDARGTSMVPGVGPATITGMAVRGDGTVFITSVEALLAIAPGTTELVRVFDCTAVVDRYCTGGGPLYTHAASDDAYLGGWKLPRSTSFPVVPDEVPPYGDVYAQRRVDAKGRLWIAQNVEGARVVDYPPYLLDVTTLVRLDAGAWKTIKTFDTPGFTWTQAEHDVLYAFGRQLIAGGIWTPWGVYSLAL